MDSDDDLFSIRDLGLAAALVSLDFKAIGTRKDDVGRVYFLFLKYQESLDVVEAYWANTLDVKARYYFDAIKSLKSRIYDER